MTTDMDQLELIQKNLRPLRLDAMPAEVASEYLTTPGRKMSGAFRRACNYARWSYYVSANQPKSVEAKLARRFSSWRIDKLHRQLRRTEKRVKILQGSISRIEVEFIRTQAITDIMLPLLAVGKALVAEIQRRGDAVSAVVQSRRMNAKDKEALDIAKKLIFNGE